MLCRAVSSPGCPCRFQSSPALTGGCYTPPGPAMPRHIVVSILTRPYGRMLCSRRRPTRRGPRCFNPHPPLRADAISVQPYPLILEQVSILTRPYGRMLWHGIKRADLLYSVSILTRPYGRMLYSTEVAKLVERMFQSSPALTGGCYGIHELIRAQDEVFQSSPALTGGCYGGTGGIVQVEANPFQSSPALTGGCYQLTVHVGGELAKFQSSPALTGGCYKLRTLWRGSGRGFNPHPPLRADAILGGQRGKISLAVSILTRPYGRML